MGLSTLNAQLSTLNLQISEYISEIFAEIEKICARGLTKLALGSYTGEVVWRYAVRAHSTPRSKEAW
jgi:hypothetical protein